MHRKEDRTFQCHSYSVSAMSALALLARPTNAISRVLLLLYHRYYVQCSQSYCDDGGSLVYIRALSLTMR